MRKKCKLLIDASWKLIGQGTIVVIVFNYAAKKIAGYI